MQNSTDLALRFAIRAEIAQNANKLGLKDGAATDLEARLIKAGAALTGEILKMPCGRSVLDYTVEAIRSGFDNMGGQYLFEQPAELAPAPKPKTPATAADVSTPAGAAKARAARQTAMRDKLALANGEAE